MLRRIREPFGKAGLIVAVIALVAALAGGAYAANALTGKQKKEVKNIAKEFAGKDGAQGPAGQPGAPGPKGDAGANGSNGKDGKNGENGKDGEDGKDGESVNVIPLSSGDANCANGGAKFNNLTGSAYACNGVSGGGGELPDTQGGYWEVQGESGLVIADIFAVSTISFSLPLDTAPTETVLINPDASEAEKDKCPGNPDEPEATPGVLCLYKAFGPPALTPANGGATKFGAVLFFTKTVQAYGSWAVSTEAPGP
jgi:hypothetical protein